MHYWRQPGDGGLYGTSHKKLYEIQQFCVDSVKLPCRFRKASVQLIVEMQYYFRSACLPFLQKDTSLSADLFVPS